jgi:hypothetical protein
LDHCLSSLGSKKLSPSEAQAILRFRNDPQPIHGLPLIDLFKRHSLFDEALEFLTLLVNEHSHYLPGKVMLAKEYYHRGMVSLGWQTLHQQVPRANTTST